MHRAALLHCVNSCSTLFHCAGAHAHPMTLTDDVSPVTIHVIVRMFLFGLEARCLFILNWAAPSAGCSKRRLRALLKPLRVGRTGAPCTNRDKGAAWGMSLTGPVRIQEQNRTARRRRRGVARPLLVRRVGRGPSGAGVCAYRSLRLGRSARPFMDRRREGCGVARSVSAQFRAPIPADTHKKPCHRPPPSRDQLINTDFTRYRVTSAGRCSYLGFSSRWHGH